MAAPDTKEPLGQSGVMDFLKTTAQKFRIPLGVVRDATTALLMLLERFGKPDEMTRLVREVPIAAELLGSPRAESRYPAIVTWIREVVAMAGTGSRKIRESLLATGLRESEIVPFVSAFVRHAESQTDREFVTRLVERVPGLARLSFWPGERETDL